MGAVNKSCMSIAKTTSSSLKIKQNTEAPKKKQTTSKAPKIEVVPDESFAPWVGEWTYIVRNEVHSFDIMIENGKLVYLENMGMTTMRGNVFVKKEGTTAKIVAKKMNFEIFLDRTKMIARYRTLGTKKWTKEIQVLKVNEIDSGMDNASCDSLGTLANTWRNQSMHDDPADGSGRLVRDGSIRGCSIRRATSLKYVGQKSDTDVEELFRQNTSKRSIRFADDVAEELRQELRKYEDS